MTDQSFGSSGRGLVWELVLNSLLSDLWRSTLCLFVFALCSGLCFAEESGTRCACRKLGLGTSSLLLSKKLKQVRS